MIFGNRRLKLLQRLVTGVRRYHLPLLWRAINWVTLMGWKLRGRGETGQHTPQYIKDFKLLEWTHQALFYEYLEMVIQVIIYNNTIVNIILSN